MGALVTDVETAAVADALNRYIEAVEERDLVKYATVVAHDDDLAWYGSMPGPHPRQPGPEPRVGDVSLGLPGEDGR